MAKRKPSQLNLLLAIDKPLGCTSHDVVARVRRSVCERRVGHAGTLDPLATGVMIVGVGQATRLLGMITLDEKSYIADISFGFETNTDDAEGEPTRVCTLDDALRDPEYARPVLQGFLGSSEQVPPAFSAISVDGVRAYKRARSGDSVELPPRPIEVRAAELIAICTPDDDGARDGVVWTVAFTVSKGTYIRALARDIGRACGSAAHVSALRRTASGGIGIGSCGSLEDLDPRSALECALDPLDVLGLRPVALSDAELSDVLLGRRIALPAHLIGCEGERVGLVHGSQLRALARADAAGLVMEQVYPQGIEGVRTCR